MMEKSNKKRRARKTEMKIKIKNAFQSWFGLIALGPFSVDVRLPKSLTYPLDKLG